MCFEVAMKFATVAAVESALKRANEKKYRVLVVDTPPGMGVVTELRERAKKDGFEVLDLDGVHSAIPLSNIDGHHDPVLTHITSLKDKVGLLVICANAPPSDTVQKIVAHAAAEFGSSVGYASLSSLYQSLDVKPAAIPAGIRAKDETVSIAPVRTISP
jgi:hypothetical protein